MELPKGFTQKYEKLLGAEAADFFTTLTTGEIYKGFRINPAKAGDAPEFQNLLTQPVPNTETGYYGTVKGRDPFYTSGWLYSQEPSAMLVAEVCAVTPGEKVLDLCAAPGGKSTRLLDQLEGQGLLVANEIYSKRAKALSENIERWGGRNALVTNHAPHELAKIFEADFDHILVDAPCSGEGMFRKEPAALAQWTPALPVECALRQREILSEALKMLKPGGRLTYSTCTFAPEEDEEIVSWLLENYPLELVDLQQKLMGVSSGHTAWGTGADLSGTVRIWPHLFKGEGHFIAQFVYRPEIEAVHKKKKKKLAALGKPLSAEQQKLLAKFAEGFPWPFAQDAAQIRCLGQKAWLIPESDRSLTHLHLLREGLELGEFKKNRFEPDFAFALAISEAQVAEFGLPHYALSFAEWQQYVAGETLHSGTSRGWLLLIYKGAVAGFGKEVQGQIKNAYPKGLRFQNR